MAQFRIDPRFNNRREPGRRLAEQVKSLGLMDPLVYAIPRGGVPVAWELAKSINAEMDLVLAHKFSSSAQPERALGSVTDAGDIWFGAQATQSGLTDVQLRQAARKEIDKLKRRRQRYGAICESSNPQGRDVIIVDDGIATGATAVAAVRSMRARQAGRIVVACPVASMHAAARLRTEGAELCLLHVEETFASVGQFYRDFDPIDDEEVASILREAEERSRKLRKSTRVPGRIRESRGISLGIDESNGASLNGTLRLPERPKGVVLFVSSGGRGGVHTKPRGQVVSRALNRAAFATIHLDLQAELGGDRKKSASSEHAGEKVKQAIHWIQAHPELSGLPIGLYGVGAGAAAALVAAGACHPHVKAVVSRGGRPDLAMDALSRVRSATLLIVGEADRPVAELNRAALKEIRGERAFVLIPGTGHLFSEPGALEEVARISQSWFERFLVDSSKDGSLSRSEVLPPER